jgi:hypothetical protein
LHFLIACVVSNERPVHVTIYKVKKTDKESYKKRTSWLLKDMKTVDGKDAYTVGTKNTFKTH